MKRVINDIEFINSDESVREWYSILKKEKTEIKALQEAVFKIYKVALGNKKFDLYRLSKSVTDIRAWIQKCIETNTYDFIDVYRSYLKTLKNIMRVKETVARIQYDVMSFTDSLNVSPVSLLARMNNVSDVLFMIKKNDGEMHNFLITDIIEIDAFPQLRIKTKTCVYEYSEKFGSYVKITDTGTCYLKIESFVGIITAKQSNKKNTLISIFKMIDTISIALDDLPGGGKKFIDMKERRTFESYMKDFLDDYVTQLLNVGKLTDATLVDWFLNNDVILSLTDLALILHKLDNQDKLHFVFQVLGNKYFIMEKEVSDVVVEYSTKQKDITVWVPGMLIAWDSLIEQYVGITEGSRSLFIGVV